MIITKLQNWWAFKQAMWRWWRTMPFVFDKRWGRGEQRRKNLNIANDRHFARKPNCEAFGLAHRYVGLDQHCRRCYCKQRESA